MATPQLAGVFRRICCLTTPPASRLTRVRSRLDQTRAARPADGLRLITISHLTRPDVTFTRTVRPLLVGVDLLIGSSPDAFGGGL
jgi:hypothetical protein